MLTQKSIIVDQQPTTWAIITGEYPPQPGGVSGYTWVVAHALAARGDAVHVFAPPSSEPELASPVHVHRLSDRFESAGRRELFAALAALPEPRRALLQFVLQSFGRRAVNAPFVWSLQRLRGYPLWIMFHEFALDDDARESFPRRIQAWLTRRLADSASRAADRAFVSTPAWQPLIARAAPEVRIDWLPIPSNVATTANANEVMRIAAHYREPAGGPLLGHFGSYRMKDANRFLAATIPAIVNVAGDRRFLLLGRGSEAFARQLITGDGRLEGRVVATGDLDAEQLANHLAACDLLLQPYADGATTRRGSLFAGLALGMPCITTLGPLSESLWRETEAAFFVPPDDVAATLAMIENVLADPSARSRIGGNARALYRDRFDVEHTVDVLRAATPSERGAVRRE